MGLPWFVGCFILAFNGLLVAWIIARPGSQTLFTTVDNLAQIVGPLLLLPFCFRWLAGPRRRNHTDAAAGNTAGAPMKGRPSTPRPGWAPTLLGLGVVTDTLGQSIWTFYTLVLHQQTPFPSWPMRPISAPTPSC